MTELPERNPNWGGARPGAGRHASSVKLSRDEVQLLLKVIQGYKKDSPVGLVIGRLRSFLDQSNSSKPWSRFFAGLFGSEVNPYFRARSASTKIEGEDTSYRLPRW